MVPPPPVAAPPRSSRSDREQDRRSRRAGDEATKTPPLESEGSAPRRDEPRSGVNRWFALLAGSAALLLIGILFGAALWVLAGIAVAAVIAMNHWLAQCWSRDSVAVRSGGDREVRIGSRIPVQVSVTNRGPVPVLWLLVEDLLPKWAFRGKSPAFQIIGSRLRVMLLMPRSTETLEYEISCHRRGYFQIGPTVLETGDLMGLFRRYRVGTEPQYVTVLPRVELLSAYDVGSRRPIGEIRMRDNMMDDPTRLRGIREWRPGDPMRSVHWAATARTGTLHSKIYEPSSIVGATLVLDMHASTNPSQHEPMRSDLAISAAASIATALHDVGEPFGLATNGRDAADRVRTEGWIGDHRVRDSAANAASMKASSDRLRPVLMDVDRGALHLKEMLRTLARLDRTDGMTLPEFLAETESRISNETTLLIIAQLLPAESIAAMISLARRGWAVAAIINTHDINDYSSQAAPLIAERVPTFHLSGWDSITDVCRKSLVR